MDNYICKIATLDEMNTKWDFEIKRAKEDKDNWFKWRKLHIDRFIKGQSIPYYGILDGKIICECTAAIDPSLNIMGNDFINNETVYLLAFRTVDEYQGKGYFRELFKYMINDLKRRGYKYAVVGVEKDALKNKNIYQRYGFTEFIKENDEIYPNGEVIYLEYYRKAL